MLLNMTGGTLVAGGVARDAELQYVGNDSIPRAKFSVAYGKVDGKTAYANCIAWRELALVASEIVRGDSVFACGHVERREYQGKTYTDIVCDFVNIARARPVNAAPASASAPASTPGNPYSNPFPPVGFTPANEEPLPF